MDVAKLILLIALLAPAGSKPEQQMTA